MVTEVEVTRPVVAVAGAWTIRRGRLCHAHGILPGADHHLAASAIGVALDEHEARK